VWLHVHDTGPGIPRAEWERVFERFTRLDRSRSRRTGGSGLGLAICRAVVAPSGGSVRVLASSEAGTTFELALPGTCASARVRSDVVDVPAAAL
jgi:signal transduction histidine kinase